jgi:hypothetical protein
METDFKQKLISLLGLESLSEEEQETLLAQVGETIARQIFLDSFDALSPENQEKVRAALEAGDEKTSAEIFAALPNQDTLIEKATKTVLDDLVGNNGETL